jgi:hypothetical protein
MALPVLAGTAAAFVAGAASALPFNKVSLPTLAWRGLGGTGACLLSIGISLLVTIHYIPEPLPGTLAEYKQRADRAREKLFCSLWCVSTIGLGVITKVALDRLSYFISAKEIGANLLMSNVAFLAAIALVKKA